MAPVRATVGSQLVFDTATGTMRRSIVDPKMALAWRDGRLEFAGDIAVEMPRPEFGKYQSVKDWVIEFPSSGLRIL